MISSLAGLRCFPGSAQGYLHEDWPDELDTKLAEIQSQLHAVERSWSETSDSLASVRQNLSELEDELDLGL